MESASVLDVVNKAHGGGVGWWSCFRLFFLFHIMLSGVTSQWVLGLNACPPHIQDIYCTYPSYLRPFLFLWIPQHWLRTLFWFPFLFLELLVHHRGWPSIPHLPAVPPPCSWNTGLAYHSPFICESQTTRISGIMGQPKALQDWTHNSENHRYSVSFKLLLGLYQYTSALQWIILWELIYWARWYKWSFLM